MHQVTMQEHWTDEPPYLVLEPHAVGILLAHLEHRIALSCQQSRVADSTHVQLGHKDTDLDEGNYCQEGVELKFRA